MTTARTTRTFRAGYKHFKIGRLCDGTIINGSNKGWPTRPGIIFCGRSKQGCIATRTDKDTRVDVSVAGNTITTVTILLVSLLTTVVGCTFDIV